MNKKNSCPDCNCDDESQLQTTSGPEGLSTIQPKNNLLALGQKLTYYKVCVSNADNENQEDIAVFHDMKSAQVFCKSMPRYVSIEIIQVTEKVVKILRSERAHYLK